MFDKSFSLIKKIRRYLFPFYKNKELQYVFNKLQEGYPTDKAVAKFVGGCVRKHLSNDVIDDIDIATILTSDEIKEKFKNTNINFSNHITKNIDEKFDTIMYLNVLEHIKEDNEEIINAFEKLNNNGYLIILVPAHNKLYSKFDKAVGHYRRYEIEFFNNLNIKDSELVKLIYLDSLGFFLYYLNKIFFKEEVYPSKFKIFLWDKIFTPISYFLDKFLMYKFGKNILYIIKKST